MYVVYVMNNPEIVLTQAKQENLVTYAKAFTRPWSTLEEEIKKFETYFLEQEQGLRYFFILEKQHIPLAYATILYIPEYDHFKINSISEIKDLWVSPNHRNKGFGKLLMEHAEKIALEKGYSKIGLSVGLYADYGPAQRLYISLGYKPDGKGITYNTTYVVPGNSYPVDDELLMWMIKIILCN